ncbi:FAD binding domain-containing protein [Histoplasma capsulatum G186AR]|uniref:FAD binding domain-containing protein n=2 Tax=Ajellomyces capsulatus TaxID=5037 RepID=C0NRT4_AJECG|nr:FAD binding domain-containing protein [Histoplasma capsulatum G186AR]EEH05600.1 FAD binding domain-containing protein [Histoplasma capsulatum G186AR]KAG5298771.1 FAD binding domain-containing protein [Histoplasma capsulatum]QSS67114.1 FAD binding domain-containing protein [Histoplasma capsulatum G186AR]
MIKIMTRLGLLFTLLGLGLASDPLDSVCRSKHVCLRIGGRYPGTVFYPGSETYNSENHHYFNAAAASKPLCVFVPRNTHEVAGAVEILAASHTEFAVRGAGHMPIPGYANTDGGVLIAFTKMKQLHLSADKSFVSVGPGNTWLNVYQYLEPHGLVALGGRVGSVGVPGLLLGGGISFYSNQYGFAANNVVSYEVVLANGKIVQATAKQNSDLFWALKGGGNSFGIVTRFDLVTFNSPQTCGGIMVHQGTPHDEFSRAISRFVQDGSKDAKAAIIPTITFIPSQDVTAYISFLFYDGAECDQPALSDFLAIPSVNNTYRQATMAQLAAEQDAFIPMGTRRSFHVVSSFATPEAIEIIYDVFATTFKAELWDVPNITTSIAYQPMTKRFVEEGDRRGGNPQGIDASKAPYFWVVQDLSWTDAKYDQRIAEYRRLAAAKTEAKLAAAGLKAEYRYMNDADKGQTVFETYGGDNLAKLKEIRAKYDPTRLFTDSLAGGWKVEHAQSKN